MVDCRVCYCCVVDGVVYGAVDVVVISKSRPDGGPDGSAMVDGTSVDVVGGGVPVCCCCWHCCCHQGSACVLVGRFMFGTMQGDDDIRHNQRLVFPHDITRHNAEKHGHTV